MFLEVKASERFNTLPIKCRFVYNKWDRHHKNNILLTTHKWDPKNSPLSYTIFVVCIFTATLQSGVNTMNLSLPSYRLVK